MMIYRRLLSAAVVCATLFAVSGTAKAEAEAEVVFHETFPFSYTFYNACTEELVDLEVEAHLYVFRVETDDGTVREMQNLNTRGWGVGEDSGAVYRFANNLHFSSVEPTGDAYSETVKRHRRLIGLGKTPNERIVSTFKLDFDEFGIMTGVDIIEIICQGD